jgi:hypothetical protein
MPTNTNTVTENDCIITLDRLRDQKGFTDADLNAHNILCNQSAHPDFFNQTILKDKFGLKFIKRTLVDIDDVDTNDKFGQTVRTDSHQSFDQLADSIKTKGFRLDGIPPCAYKLKDKWSILDGRTRISIIKDTITGGKLLINLYEKIDTTIPDTTFALYCNTQHRHAGHATSNDLYGHIENLINTGYFKYDKKISQDIAGAEFKETISLYVEDKCPGVKLSSPQKEKLLKHAMSKVKVSSHIIPFNSADHVEKHLRDTLGIYDCPKFKYIITTTDEWGIFKAIMPKLAELEADKKNKQVLRVVVVKQQPKDVADWYKANIRVGLKMARHLKAAGKMFGTSSKKSTRVEIFGTIAQCRTEDKRFPKDELIKYSEITLADYNKFGDKISDAEFQELKNAL